MKLYLIGAAALLAVGCSNAPQVSQTSNSANLAPQRAEKMETVAAHTTENQNPTMRNVNAAAQAGGKTKWTQSGEPIDTAEFDAAIAKAEKDAKARPTDEAANKAASEAYFKRGFALTQARQYATAIGDYRKALKYDPENAEAKDWIEQIVGIYEMMNKEYPKEGEEPPPLPFKKG